MKATELRIGNLVYYGNDKVAEEVTTTTLIFIEYWNLNKGKDKNKPENRYKPIPLTEEWLLNFGFKLDVETDAYYSNDEFATLHIEGYLQKEMIEGCYDVRLKYVHQLQNLYFALTGEEL